MKKILLLELEGVKNTEKSSFDLNLMEFKSRQRLWNTPNLGLLTVGGCLSDRFYIDYIDLNYEKQLKPDYDYVFMSPSTSQANRAYELSHFFHQNNVRVVLGGPHASMMPVEAKIYSDTVFIGESENILKTIDNVIPEGVITCEKKTDLELFDFVPLYGLSGKYPYTSFPVQLSRGCPHQCSFCISSSIYGKKIRRKTLAQANKELMYLKSFKNRPFVFFTDDNFFLDENYILKLFDILKNLKIEWYAFTDISIYKKDKILKRLYSSGCRKLLIGFESLNSDNLEKINKSGFKKNKRGEYEKAINIIQSNKIGVVGSFVLGLDNDTEETFDELYDFIVNTKIYGTNITIATPFPGTRYYEELSEKENLPCDWSLYDGFTLVHKLKNISSDRFMIKYKELIAKINSPERINSVLDFFKKVN